MKKSKYTFKKYLFISISILFLTFLGSIFIKTYYHMTPAAHYFRAIELLEKDQTNQAFTHLILANKSSESGAKMFSAYRLAQLYHLGEKGFTKNISKAVFYYEQAADLGMLKAKYNLALLYNTGDKVPENREKAFQYMKEAAQVMPEAKYVLAVWMEQGYLGKKNKEEAIILYEQAANAGIKNAIKSLIAIYHMEKEQTQENINREQYWRNRLKGSKNDIS